MARTSIVVKMLDGFRRACLPADGPGHKDVPYYRATYQANGIHPDGRRTWTQPAHVQAGGGGHLPHAGRVRDVRVVNDDYADKLHAIDAERDAIKQRLTELAASERLLMEEAWEDAGVGVSVSTVKAWTVEVDKRRQAARDAA